MNVNEERKGEGGDTKPGISAILAATQNPYYFTPHPIPPVAFPFASSLRSRREKEGPPPEAATCHCVEKLQL